MADYPNLAVFAAKPLFDENGPRKYASDPECRGNDHARGASVSIDISGIIHVAKPGTSIRPIVTGRLNVAVDDGAKIVHQIFF